MAQKLAMRGAWGVVLGLLALSLAPTLAYAATPSIVSAQITNSDTVVITYTEPVNTSISDYSNFSGALQGVVPSSIGGSGTATVTLVFGGANFPANATGALSVASTTTSVSTASPFVAGSVNLSDGQPPAVASLTLSSNNVANGLAQPGAVITASLTANEPIQTPTITINGHALGVSGSGAGPYTATYTIVNGDPATTVTLEATLVDLAGNNAVYGAQIAAGTTPQATTPTPAVPVVAAVTPQISQSTAVPVYNMTSTPSFTLTSNVAGSLTYGGSCTSAVANVAAGVSTVTLSSLPDGFYNNCTVTLHDTSGNSSNTIALNPFTIDTSNGATTSSGSSATVGDGYKFLNPLDVGSTGTDVTELQKRLTAIGDYSGPITGYYGSLTQAAVKVYQGAHSLSTMYGNLGPATRADLNSGE